MYFSLAMIALSLICLAGAVVHHSWPAMVRRWMLRIVDREIRLLYPKRSELLSIRRLRSTGLSTGRHQDTGLTLPEGHRLRQIEQRIDDLEALENNIIHYRPR